jgi:hypothetical protein
MVVSVEAGEDGGPGGAAQRLAGEGVLEGDAFFYQQGADLWHLLGGGVVQVVGEDEDDVGLIGRRLCFFFLRRIGCRGLGFRTACAEEKKDRHTPH